MSTRLFIALVLVSAGFIALKGYPENGSSMQNLDDTLRINVLNRLAEKFSEQYQQDSCLKYASKAYFMCDRLLTTKAVQKNPEYEKQCKVMKAKSLTIIAQCMNYNNASQVLDTLQAALRLANEAGDKNEQAYVYACIGEYYESLSRDQPALENNLRSLAIYRETGNKKALAGQLTNVGITERNMGNYGDAMGHFMQSLKISKEISDSLSTIEALLAIGFTYAYVERWDDALKMQRQALEIYQQMKDSLGIARIYNDMGVTNLKAGKLRAALKLHQTALSIRLNSKEYYYTFASYLYIGDIYEKLNMLPDAINNYKAGLEFSKYSKFKVSTIDALMSLGSVYLRLSDYQNALGSYSSALDLSHENKNGTTEAQASMNIAKVYLAMGEPRKALGWLQKAEKAAPKSALVFLGDIYQSIGETYFRLSDYENAYLNLKKYTEVKDSLVIKENLEKITTLSNRLEFENKQALQNESHDKMLAIKQAQIEREKTTRNFSIFGMLVAFIMAVIILVRFIEKNKLNNRLNETLSNLKSTQSQLIYAEKMASLGELVAGIAHEIQNPLNFVNNFSEINKELLMEMKDELDKGNMAEVNSIANDIFDNEKKINHHGKRADAIVKGMLQHSRTNSGVKEPTDINALADEYLRLSYHGLRAKDKSFNATMNTDFDESIGKVSIVPQDIGRVILNLLNNAFYAVTEKKKLNIDGYEPVVAISTKLIAGKIEIKVSDNGNGIPLQVLDKIFQPFFTTKPTGQGTGLGLSLSYDIITKGHGGELNVKTKEGQGTEFIIVLKN